MKQRIVVTLCDKCGKDGPTTAIRIGMSESLKRLDLCDHCAVPARTLFDLAERTRQKRRSVASMHLVSMDEVVRRRSVRPQRPLWHPGDSAARYQNATKTPSGYPGTPQGSGSPAVPHRDTPGLSPGRGDSRGQE